MNKKVLIIGASGLVGYSLYEHFSKDYEVIGTYNTHPFNNLIHLNLLNRKNLGKILKKSNPDIILLPAALSAVDYCEKNKDECWNHNVNGPDNLIRLIRKSTKKLVYYSTDFIFDGENGPYIEEDVPNPLNNYGKAKFETELNIRTNLLNWLIIRTTVVYGWEHQGKNFIYRLIKTLREGSTIKVPKDQVGTPTLVDNLAEATKKLVDANKTGIYNVVGSELMDRYMFALTAAGVFDLNKSLIEAVTTSELNQLASRPLNGGLLINKLIKDIKIKMLAPKEGLEYLKRSKKDYALID
ncbi:MAG: SDR family oxidoreductase [Promethearchaeota archaeon]